MPEKGFWIFFLFFSEFPCAGQVWTEFGTKIFFFSFSTNLIPFWLKIMPESGFLIFCFFLAILFGIFLPRVEYERNSGLKFFSRFLFQSLPVLAKNNTGKRFFNFLLFLLFFSEFSSPGRVWTEFGTKIFFALSHPISSRFG